MKGIMWIEIFRTGKHTDSSGYTAEYSAESLDKIANVYNERAAAEDDLAPLVKGHPKSDDPAYGWVERLARRGDKLLAKVKDVVPQIADEVKKKMFKKVSIALYPDMMLRHVGLLGAAAPAVKGLRAVNFSEDKDFCEFEFGSCIVQMPFENEDVNTDEQTSREYEELQQRNRELEEKIELIEKETRLKEYREFANSLIENEAGSLITPAQADELIDLLEMAFQSDRSKAGEFAENSGAVDKVKSFMMSLQPVFSTEEFARRTGGESDMQYEDFSDRNVAPERLTLHERALEMVKSHPGLSYEEAVCKAQRRE